MLTIVLEVCPQMPTLTRVSTTEMEVTSIRLERSLKEKLKALAGERGYQALIRDILWQYLEQSAGEHQGHLQAEDIRASFEAVAEQEQACALTGKIIHPKQPMRLGLTAKGALVPLWAEVEP
jgi:predicted DNA-binding protein